MTQVTQTYDSDEWKLVPKRTTKEMRDAFKSGFREGSIWVQRIDIALDDMLAAAHSLPVAAPVDAKALIAQLTSAAESHRSAGDGIWSILNAGRDYEPDEAQGLADGLIADADLFDKAADALASTAPVVEAQSVPAMTFEQWFDDEFPAESDGSRIRYRNTGVMDLMRAAWEGARAAVPVAIKEPVSVNKSARHVQTVNISDAEIQALAIEHSEWTPQGYGLVDSHRMKFARDLIARAAVQGSEGLPPVKNEPPPMPKVRPVPLIGDNTGHGHVWRRPDGLRARCGGPGICQQCSADAARTANSTEGKS